MLQPTADGGYSLIALRAPAPALFARIPWSTERVMAQTRARLRRLRLKWAELPETYDVDTVEDSERYGRTLG